VEIKFISTNTWRGKLIINGRLVAMGQENDKIIFTASNDQYYWNRIEFNSQEATSTLKYVLISKGGVTYEEDSRGIIYVNGKVEFQNLSLEGACICGVYFDNSPQSKISDSQFEFANCGIGIKIIGQCPQISNLTFINTFYPFCKDDTCSTSTNSTSTCQ